MTPCSLLGHSSEMQGKGASRRGNAGCGRMEGTGMTTAQPPESHYSGIAGEETCRVCSHLSSTLPGPRATGCSITASRGVSPGAEIWLRGAVVCSPHRHLQTTPRPGPGSPAPQGLTCRRADGGYHMGAVSTDTGLSFELSHGKASFL